MKVLNSNNSIFQIKRILGFKGSIVKAIYFLSLTHLHRVSLTPGKLNDAFAFKVQTSLFVGYWREKIFHGK